MDSQQEDCRHQRAFVDRWFQRDRERKDDSLYWGHNKQREIRLLELMLEEPERASSHKITRRSQEHEAERFFDTLADEWRRETAHLSSLTKKITHPAYLRIISLGYRAVPLILKRLEREPAYWFVALRALSGQDPVPAGDVGNFRATREAWLTWGRSKGFI